VDARLLVVRILNAFDSSRASNLGGIFDAAFKTARVDRRDKRFVFEIVYGILRWRIRLDYLIDRLLSNDRLRSNESLRCVLQLGLYQLLFLDRIPHHAAVFESVQLAKNLPDTRALAGVVNAVLRRVIADRHAVSLPDELKDPAERLSIEYSHPRWMVERWLKNFGLGNTKKLLAFNNERPEIYLRRKIRGLSKQQFEAEVHSLCDPSTGFLNLYYRLKKNISPDMVGAIDRGFCNVQAPSSGWVVALADAQKGEKILDVCSSPGGKTAMMSELVGETGSMCACDDRLSRIRLCIDTFNRMHLMNIYTLVADGRFPPFAGIFDKVLVDAPCSSTGILHRHPEARLIRTPADIVSMSSLQGEILDSAAALVGSGGTIIYSTCSLEPEENEAQIELFLRKHPDFRHIECPECIPQNFIDALKFLSITPFSHGIDGMFGARLKRVGP
jgi:16S rRNA (cytosine967-C5)-methyltransferase